jgi:hypothetical protein
MKVIVTVLVLWAVLLGAGSWRIAWRPKTAAPAPSAPPSGCLSKQQKQGLPHWIAARAMPVNWLVRATDLAAPVRETPPDPAAFVGKYVSCKIGTGDDVVQSDLGALLDIPPAAGKDLLPFPLSTQELDVLNAGSHVSLFEKSVEVVSAGEVAALDCRSSCVAWLQVSPAEHRSLDPTKLPQLRLVPR